jgi:hypothetical protein
MLVSSCSRRPGGLLAYSPGCSQFEPGHRQAAALLSGPADHVRAGPVRPDPGISSALGQVALGSWLREDGMAQVTCETCVAACCRAGSTIMLTTIELQRHRRAMTIKPLVKPQAYRQEVSVTSDEISENGEHAPVDTTLSVPPTTGCMSFFLTARTLKNPGPMVAKTSTAPSMKSALLRAATSNPARAPA